MSPHNIHVVTRAATAGSISGQESAWKPAGRAGFANFVDILDQQDAAGGAALDESVRYR